jgi:hypothetical protein
VDRLIRPVMRSGRGKIYVLHQERCARCGRSPPAFAVESAPSSCTDRYALDSVKS